MPVCRPLFLNKRHVGTFPPNNPPKICSQPAIRCYSERATELDDRITGIELEDSDSVEAKGAQVAWDTFKALMPEATVNCDTEDQPGCFAIKVTTAEGSPKVGYEVTYHMPVFTPLNTFLGKDSIKITHGLVQSMEKFMSEEDDRRYE